MSAARPGYRQVAAKLREDILTGKIAPNAVLDSNPVLAVKHGEPGKPLSTATVNAAVSELAAEGLVSVGHGRPTTVVAQRRFLAEMYVPAADAEAGARALRAAVTAAVGADPMMTPPDDAAIVTQSAEDSGRVRIAALVTAAEGGLAAYRLGELVRIAAGANWDVAGAAWSVTPA